MIQAVVGSGGKTTLIHRLVEEYRAQGKKVFVTTTTHMRIEADTLLTDDPRSIIQALEETGYVMAGIREGEEKIRALPREVYAGIKPRFPVCVHVPDAYRPPAFTRSRGIAFLDIPGSRIYHRSKAVVSIAGNRLAPVFHPV